MFLTVRPIIPAPKTSDKFSAAPVPIALAHFKVSPISGFSRLNSSYLSEAVVSPAATSPAPPVAAIAAEVAADSAASKKAEPNAP